MQEADLRERSGVVSSYKEEGKRGEEERGARERVECWRMAKMMKKNQKNKALPRARFGGYGLDEEEEEEEERK